jgi:hypothetical protein
MSSDRRPVTLHNEVIHDLYSSPNNNWVAKSRRMRFGYVACMGALKNACTIVVRQSERKRPLGRLRCRWEDNIKMDKKEIWCEGVDWIHLAQDRDRWQARFP